MEWGQLGGLGLAWGDKFNRCGHLHGLTTRSRDMSCQPFTEGAGHDGPSGGAETGVKDELWH